MVEDRVTNFDTPLNQNLSGEVDAQWGGGGGGNGVFNVYPPEKKLGRLLIELRYRQHESTVSEVKQISLFWYIDVVLRVFFSHPHSFFFGGGGY